MSRDCFEGFVVVGYSRNLYGEKPVFSGTDEEFVTLEDHIKFEAGFLRMFIARFFCSVYVGEYKSAKPGCNYLKYYLVWCKLHKKFSVTYPQVYEGRIQCTMCAEDVR